MGAARPVGLFRLILLVTMALLPLFAVVAGGIGVSAASVDMVQDVVVDMATEVGVVALLAIGEG